jgi:hypothetical protein
MSATFTGSPPSGQVASHRHDPGGRDASRARRRLGVPRASSTPGRLWLVRAGLVLDADVTVSTAYLYGRTGPNADRVRYRARTLT